MRAWLRLARWRLRRSWRRLRLAGGLPAGPEGATAAPAQDGAATTSELVRPAGRRPRRGWPPPTGWPLRALLRGLAAAGIACPLLALSVVCLAAVRAHLAAPAPSLLLLDRHGRFLGELPGGPPAHARTRTGHPLPRRRRRRRGGRARVLAGPGAAAAGGRGDPGARGPPLRLPPWRRSAGGGAGAAAEPADARPGLGGVDARHAGGAHAEPGHARLLAQGDRGGHRRLPHRALRLARGAAPLPAPGPLRQPHPRHRLRRAQLLRQAGRRPVLGRDRLPVGTAAGAGAHESVLAGRPRPRRPPRRARARRAGRAPGAVGRRVRVGQGTARGAAHPLPRAPPCRGAARAAPPADAARRGRDAGCRDRGARCRDRDAGHPGERCRPRPAHHPGPRPAARRLRDDLARAARVARPRRRQRLPDRPRPRPPRGARLGGLGGLFRRRGPWRHRLRAGAALGGQHAQALPLRLGARARGHRSGHPDGRPRARSRRRRQRRRHLHGTAAAAGGAGQLAQRAGRPAAGPRGPRPGLRPVPRAGADRRRGAGAALRARHGDRRRAGDGSRSWRAPT